MARPKAFDPEEALTRAMDVFWTQGFEAASIAELTAAMGINKFSLYATFGDKRSLFLKALQHYRKTAVAEQFACLAPGCGLNGMHAFFNQFLTAPAAFRVRGCLMVTSLVELAGRDREIDRAVREHFKWVERCFARTLREAQNAGELRTDINVNEKAQSLLALVQGVIVLGKAPFGRKVAEVAIRDGLASLGT
jgi:TetR/AcrR family transcriptional repressor of nem operon